VPASGKAHAPGLNDEVAGISSHRFLPEGSSGDTCKAVEGEGVGGGDTDCPPLPWASGTAANLRGAGEGHSRGLDDNIASWAILGCTATEKSVLHAQAPRHQADVPSGSCAQGICGDTAPIHHAYIPADFNIHAQLRTLTISQGVRRK